MFWVKYKISLTIFKYDGPLQSVLIKTAIERGINTGDDVMMS